MTKKILPFLVAFAIASGSYAQLTTYSASANEIGELIMPPNCTIGGASYIGDNGSFGKFYGSYTNLGINSGAIISTGAISGASAPNPGTNIDLHLPGPPSPFYSLMSAEVNNSLYDASLLHFSFFSESMQGLSFRYVFSSEEYNEFVGTQYKDMFAIYLLALGSDTPVNIAKLPVNGQPIISPTTVNNGHSNGCSSGNSASNPQFYVDNCNDQTIQYDGFTTPLTASTTLIPNTFYHIWFVITDVGDGNFDSGVFIQSVPFGVGIDESSTASPSVYPNPSTGRFTLANLTEKTEINVTNSAGQPVLRQTITQTGNAEIILDEFPAGIYFLSQRSETSISTTKIILQK